MSTLPVVSDPTTDEDPSIDPSLKSSEAWKRFEVEVHERLIAIDARAVIEHDVKLPGSASLVNRQIDVLARNHIVGSPLKVVVECKAYKRRLDVGKVDEFLGKLLDVRANHGILYALNGVTKAAQNRADNALPTIEIRDMSVVVEAVHETPDEGDLVEPDDGWITRAAWALGYRPCPVDGCFGEVVLTEWEPDDILAGFCGYCGALVIECSECETLDYVETGETTCYGCGAVHLVGHDGKGEPNTVELTSGGVDSDVDDDLADAPQMAASTDLGSV